MKRFKVDRKVTIKHVDVCNGCDMLVYLSDGGTLILSLRELLAMSTAAPKETSCP